MDEGLFKRHLQSISKREEEKKRVIELIQKHTGVVIDEIEIEIGKKEITLHISSVKKAKLTQKGIRSILSKNGYTLV